MKRFTSLLLLAAGLSTTAQARDGYHINLKFNDTKDTMVYLAHYYGKALPTIYKADSARFDKNGNAVFNSKEPLNGGIYMMLLSDKSTYFEFLLNNGDDIGITAPAKNLPDGLVFKNSPENERFQQYEQFLKNFSIKQEGLKKEMAEAKNSIDTAAVRKKADDEQKKFTAYRRDYAAKYPGTLLAAVFNGLDIPTVPEGPHKLPDGRNDSTFAYRYYKAHYWDKFDLKDNRLINTPLFDARLDEYMNKLVVPEVDSVEKESDLLLAKTRGQKDLFNYTLMWLTHNAEGSKFMGMDEVFVYLVENYYMKGDATWLSSEDLEKYAKRSREIRPNVIGNVAPEIVMQDVNGKEVKLSDVKSKYTVVVFWEPSCGHCQKEVPALDSVYNAVLKKKGVKVFAVRTDDPVKQWQEFIQKNHLEEWTNVYDPEHHSNYHADYDVKTTPTIYLLDEKKIIRGKKIDHSNIEGLIDYLNKKEKEDKKGKS